MSYPAQPTPCTQVEVNCSAQEVVEHAKSAIQKKKRETAQKQRSIKYDIPVDSLIVYTFVTNPL